MTVEANNGSTCSAKDEMVPSMNKDEDTKENEIQFDGSEWEEFHFTLEKKE